MSAERRLRRRSRIVHDPIVKARVATSMARGLTLREAADRHMVPERSARNWTHEHHWERWIELARDSIARSPLQRDDAVAQFLIDELHRGNVDERPAITRANVEDLKAKALAQAAAIGQKFWDAPAEAVVCWLARKHADVIGSSTPPITLEGQGDFWGAVLVRALSTYENLKCYAAETEDRPPWCPPTTRPHYLNPHDKMEDLP